MQPLDERRRKHFSAFSAILCSVPIFLVPLAGRSSLELPTSKASIQGHYEIPRLTPVLQARAVKILRDPFVADAEVTGKAEPHPLTAFDSSMPIVPIVHAIVSGPAPRALVVENGSDRIVAVGDVLAGSRITAIDPTGVRLANGAIFSLSEGTP
jgi:hypothetical protein